MKLLIVFALLGLSECGVLKGGNFEETATSLLQDTPIKTSDNLIQNEPEDKSDSIILNIADETAEMKPKEISDIYTESKPRVSSDSLTASKPEEKSGNLLQDNKKEKIVGLNEKAETNVEDTPVAEEPSPADASERSMTRHMPMDHSYLIPHKPWSNSYQSHNIPWRQARSIWNMIKNSDFWPLKRY